jgi:hypothetical protein
MYGSYQTLQNERFLRDKKNLQYKVWKARNSNASKKRKRDAKWIRNNTSTVNSDYPGLFDNV